MSEPTPTDWDAEYNAANVALSLWVQERALDSADFDRAAELVRRMVLAVAGYAANFAADEAIALFETSRSAPPVAGPGA
jgi:hypothetical protein